jgi:hypothetical protein
MLLGYYTALNGNPLPTFWDNILVPSSRVKKSKKNGIWYTITIRRCIITQKNTDLISITAKSSNHESKTVSKFIFWDVMSCNLVTGSNYMVSCPRSAIYRVTAIRLKFHIPDDNPHHHEKIEFQVMCSY